MNMRRVGVLLRKDIVHGPKNFIFFWAFVAPVLVSLVLSLVFGTIFAGKAELGLVDLGSSALVARARALDSLTTRQFDTSADLKKAVEQGSVDIGLVIPANFDEMLKAGDNVSVTGYVWGESLARDRYTIGVAFANLARDVTGLQSPVQIDTVNLGGSSNVPWTDRLLPLIVLLAVFIGGVFVPATALIEEKEKKTLTALVVTPASVGEVFLSKGIMGAAISLFMGIVILVLNQAFGNQPAELVLLLFLGAVMAGEIGLISGALIKDVTTFFALWKSAGIVLFGPAIIFMFPAIPEWVGRIFPTYYLLKPIMTIAQGGAGWAEIAINVFVLIGIDIVLAWLVVLTLQRRPQLAT